MDISIPEHRFYTVLCALQAGIVMIGTVAIRVSTAEFLYGNHRAVPLLAVFLRNWGFILLLVPAIWLGWTIRAIARDEGGEESGRRMLIGLGVTLLLGLLFWYVWDRASVPNHSVSEIGNM